MAKTATQKKKEPPRKEPPRKEPPPQRGRAQVPAVRREGGLPAALRERAKSDAGKGSSSLAEDNLIPLVYVLQSNSPQAQERNPAHIEGASAGSIWLRGADDPIIDGEEGAMFQPCYFGKEWLEWLPNRGGFVGRHDKRPREAVQVEDPQRKGRMLWRLPNGNDVVETRFYAGYIWRPGEERALPYIVPFKGTGHSVARGFMNQINAKFEAGGERPDPSWLHVYQLTTTYRENDAGNWFLLQVGYVGPVTSEEEYDRGAKLNAAFASGAVKAQVDETSDRSGPAEDEDM